MKESETFQTKRLGARPDAIAPDGSAVRLLLGVSGGGMAHFELAANETSIAVMHRTVEEIWYILSGQGEMWRRAPDGTESVVPLEPHICLTIPVGTRFQFRALGSEALEAIGVTMPPWPGTDEAIVIDGAWPPSVRVSGS